MHHEQTARTIVDSALNFLSMMEVNTPPEKVHSGTLRAVFGAFPGGTWLIPCHEEPTGTKKDVEQVLVVKRVAPSVMPFVTVPSIPLSFVGGRLSLSAGK
jgi:hypothetical protein